MPVFGSSAALSRLSVSIPFGRDQPQSPLFNLPGELRNEIYRLVLQPYIDLTRLYPEDAPYRLPGLEGVKKVETALLLTCKRAYDEAHHFPLCELVPTFYIEYGNWRVPEEYYEPKITLYTPRYLQKFEPKHWARLRHLHVVILADFLEYGAFQSPLALSPVLAPSRLTLTIRYGETVLVWDAGTGKAPMHPNQLLNVPLPGCVDSITLELEIHKEALGRMDSTIQGIFQWPTGGVFNREDGVVLRIKGTKWEERVKTWRWVGPVTYPEQKLVVFCVRAVTWEVDKALRKPK